MRLSVATVGGSSAEDSVSRHTRPASNTKKPAKALCCQPAAVVADVGQASVSQRILLHNMKLAQDEILWLFGPADPSAALPGKNS